MQMIINKENVVFTNENGKVFTDSISVSRVFNKEHSGSGGVISIIEKMPKDFSLGNFTESRFEGKSGQLHKNYKMTRKGMTMLIMSFTGKKAFSWKEKYITAFEAMEEKLIQKPSLQMDIHLKRLDSLTEIARHSVATLEEHQETLKEQDMRINQIEKTQTIIYWQQKSLIDSKNFIVYSLGGEDKKLIRKLHSRVWSVFKKRFSIPRYTELPFHLFTEGKSFINGLTMGDLL